MKTLTMKLPEPLLAWLEKEARRLSCSKSAVVRGLVQQRHRQSGRSALDLAGDLCGCASSGWRDLSHNKKHLRGFGR